MVLKRLALFVHLQRTVTNPIIRPNGTCDMVRSSANRVVKCDNFTKVLLVITVTANSSKWQQALGFVSCAQASQTVRRHRGEPTVYQPETSTTW